MPTLEDAVSFALTLLRQQAQPGTRPSRRPGSNYGYDFYAPAVAREWAMFRSKNSASWDSEAQAASPVFYEALWELCRRGILRPGVTETTAQGIADGGGYCVTTYGRTWLSEANESHFILMQPGSLATAFEQFSEKFGPGYRQRTQEAIRCRTAEAWLAACAMVGAAAESILLAVAVAKSGNEDQAMGAYAASNGRRSIMNQIIGQAPAHISRPLTSGMSLLSYWRDSAGHGQVAIISGAEAD